MLDLASPHMAIGEAVSVLRDDEGQLSLRQVHGPEVGGASPSAAAAGTYRD